MIVALIIKFPSSVMQGKKDCVNVKPNFLQLNCADKRLTVIYTHMLTIGLKHDFLIQGISKRVISSKTQLLKFYLKALNSLPLREKRKQKKV